jgi:hypothetical protein
MPRNTLKNAAKARTRRSAKNVASKMADTAKSAVSSASSIASKVSSTAASVSSSVAGKTTSGTNSSVVVPGLVGITPDKIAGMMPSFTESAYQISDPLNPPENMPQASQAQFDKGMAVYEGAQRALKLTGAAFDTTRERFVTVGKQAKAFGAGIQSATEFEKVRGNYFDYLNQLEVNNQKATTLDVSQHKTVTDANKAVHDKAGMDEKLKQSEISAEKARQETQKKQGELTEFQKQLGDYAKAS